MFRYQTYVRMHDVDAAGVLFFANQFRLVHEAYEAFMASGDLALGRLLEEGDYLLPIVHAESDFKSPLRVGDKLEIRLLVKKTGESSYVIEHHVLKENGKTAGRGETVHVCIQRGSGEKIPIPVLLQTLLEVHRK